MATSPRRGHTLSYGDGRQGQARQSTRHRERHTLGEQLPRQACLAGSERGADGELGRSCHGADDEEIGDVGAADEQ